MRAPPLSVDHISDLIPTARNTAFIFDFDGVVVESVHALYRVYLRFLQDYGVRGSSEEFERLSGPNLDQIIKYLIDTYDLPGTHASLRQRYLGMLEGLYDGVGLIHGVREVLEFLGHLGISVAIASSCNRRDIESTLKRHNLDHFFEFIVSGDDVHKAKPHPAIYLSAKAQFGGGKEHFFVVEDADLGIDSARSAGCRPIKFGSSNFRNVPYWLREIGELKHVVGAEINCTELVFRSDCITLNAKSSITSDVLPAHEAEIISDLWQAGVRQNPRLTNDPILFLDNLQIMGEDVLIQASVGEYSLAYAQSTDLDLNIAPTLAVSAYLVDQKGNTLIGQRGSSVTEYADYFEFVPSGGLSPSSADLDQISEALVIEQVISELTEETGLMSGEVRAVDPVGGVLDRLHNVMDIVCRVQLSTPIIQDTLVSNEHHSLEVISLSDLTEVLQTRRFTPTSMCIGSAFPME